MNALELKIDTELQNSLLDRAREAAGQAYAPYSNFSVGAALLCKDEHVVLGCNVENASYGLSICAERTAATTAIMQGRRDWLAMAIVSPTGVSPCGACRQFLAEFHGELVIIIGNMDRETKPTVFNLQQLLPAQMSLHDFQLPDVK